jgi:hypothetical protein
MAWEGGAVPVIAAAPSIVTQTAQTAASTAAVAGLQQVWQGAGQSFFGEAGQALTGNLAGSAVNIALNSALGSEVAGPGGFNLTSGATVLASTVTPFVTTSVAAGINQSISNSLQNAGPFAGVLSGVSTSLVNAAVGGITDAIFGGAVGGFAEDYKSFPGGSASDPDADYGGIAYTRTDVTFSIQPANQGPQAFGDTSFAFPSSLTTLPFGELASMPLLAGNETADVLKSSAMVGGLSQASANISSSNFDASLNLGF